MRISHLTIFHPSDLDEILCDFGKPLFTSMDHVIWPIDQRGADLGDGDGEWLPVRSVIKVDMLSSPSEPA